MCEFVSIVFFFFKQKTAYDMRISDWSSDVCSSDLAESRGEMGSAAFKSVMNFKSLGVQFNTDLGAARKAVTRSSALLGAGRAAGTELVMSGIMNTNSIFYTDDTLDNIANMAVGIGVGGFLGGIQGGWALRKAANSKAMEAERVGAYDPKGFERVRRGSGPID